MHSDTTACHSLPPICCCAYSLLVHPSNNGRRMRGNVSVSMAQPLRSHYYIHKSFRCPISPSSLLPFSSSLSPPHKHTRGIHMCLDDKTPNRHTQTPSRVLTLTSFWKNNRPSRHRRRHLGSPWGNSKLLSLKSVRGCVCRHVPGCVCVCVCVPFSHFICICIFQQSAYIYILIVCARLWLSVDNETRNESPLVHSSLEGGDTPFSSLRFTSLLRHWWVSRSTLNAWPDGTQTGSWW